VRVLAVEVIRTVPTWKGMIAMKRQFNLISFSRVLAVALFGFAVSVTPLAKASVQIQLAENGGGFSTVGTAPSGTTASFIGTFNDFSIQAILASSNSPGGSGTPAQSQLLGTTLNITNTSGSTQTLHISLGDTGFTFPANGTDVTLTSGIGGSVTVDTVANAVTYQTYVNSNNSQNGTSGPLTSGPLNPDVHTNPASWDISNMVGATISYITAFSMTQRIDIILGAGGQINFSSTEFLTSGRPGAVPEASSLAIWSMLGLSIGLLHCRNRRKSV
jgi:hypothetical protein